MHNQDIPQGRAKCQISCRGPGRVRISQTQHAGQTAYGRGQIASRERDSSRNMHIKSSGLRKRNFHTHIFEGLAERLFRLVARFLQRKSSYLHGAGFRQDQIAVRRYGGRGKQWLRTAHGYVEKIARSHDILVRINGSLKRNHLSCALKSGQLLLERVYLRTGRCRRHGFVQLRIELSSRCRGQEQERCEKAPHHNGGRSAPDEWVPVKREKQWSACHAGCRYIERHGQCLRSIRIMEVRANFVAIPG